MNSSYIALDQRLSAQEIDSSTSGYESFQDLSADLISDTKASVNTTSQLSRKVKRVLSKSFKKFTSTVTQKSPQRKSSQRKSRMETDHIVVYGHGDATGVTFCIVNAAFS